MSKTVDPTPEEFATFVRRWLVDADWIMNAFGISRPTVFDWVAAGVIPRPIAVLGGARLWDAREFENVTRPQKGIKYDPTKE
jgi:predicted DNA-binding transcriptional regulator AlpA